MSKKAKPDVDPRSRLKVLRYIALALLLSLIVLKCIQVYKMGTLGIVVARYVGRDSFIEAEIFDNREGHRPPPEIEEYLNPRRQPTSAPADKIVSYRKCANPLIALFIGIVERIDDWSFLMPLMVFSLLAMLPKSWRPFDFVQKTYGNGYKRSKLAIRCIVGGIIFTTVLYFSALSLEPEKKIAGTFKCLNEYRSIFIIQNIEGVIVLLIFLSFYLPLLFITEMVEKTSDVLMKEDWKDDDHETAILEMLARLIDLPWLIIPFGLISWAAVVMGLQVSLAFIRQPQSIFGMIGLLIYAAPYIVCSWRLCAKVSAQLQDRYKVEHKIGVSSLGVEIPFWWLRITRINPTAGTPGTGSTRQ